MVLVIFYHVVFRGSIIDSLPLIVISGFNITISTFKNWVNVNIVGGDHTNYEQVTGLMGDFGGHMLGRDGTEFMDIDALGQDWQVRPEEGNYFRTARAPQYPEGGKLPKTLTKSARFLAETVAEEAAEEACAHYRGNALKMCIQDVLASGDIQMANAGAY